MIEIYAGSTAKQTLLDEGFKPELFTTFLGASGGPKWFTLFGLDKYVFGEFFANRNKPLNIVGSSAGAFRAACFGQNDPVKAIERLAKNYSETVYSKKAKAPEITEKARILLDILYGDTGATEIINNPVFKSHFIVAKCNGLVASNSNALQMLGLTNSFARNMVSRTRLTRQYQRYIFQPKDSDFSFEDPDRFKTVTHSHTSENIKDSLLASGSIPLVMEGIKDIHGCAPGMYRDGGIIDYHFDIKIKNPGLVLYPHFSSNIKAGWFDKNIARRARTQHYENTVVICPTKAFVDSLPYSKIPDRTDFTTMEPEQRIAYWQTVLNETDRLAESFADFIDKQSIETIKDIRLITDE